MRELSGKVAVVTGAASGMGRAFAQRFAEEGMRVVLADIEAPALEAAVQEMRRAEHEVIGVRTDVTEFEDVQALAQQALDAYGKVHVVSNNAGVDGYLEGPIWEATESRLGLDLRRELLGRCQRPADFRARPPRAGRGGAHRQHLLGHLHRYAVEYVRREQARGAGAVRSGLRPVEATRREGRHHGTLPRHHSHTLVRGLAQPAPRAAQRDRARRQRGRPRPAPDDARAAQQHRYGAHGRRGPRSRRHPQRCFLPDHGPRLGRADQGEGGR